MVSRAPVFLVLLVLLGSPALAQPKAISERPGRVELSWPGVDGATGYSVMRSKGDSQGWVRLASLKAKALRYTDATATPRTPYRYRVDPTGAQGTPTAPVEALDRFYLELRGADAAQAKLYVHRWDPDFEEWLRSDLLTVAVGKTIGRPSMITDFTTGATLRASGPDPKTPGVERIDYVTASGRTLSVSTVDVVPAQVRKPKKKKVKTPEAVARKTPSTTDGPAAPRTGSGSVESLAFPEPKRVGSVAGTKVVWTITNSSEQRMNVLILNNRGAKRFFKLGPGKEYTSRFKRGGTYKVSATVDEVNIRPLEGSFGLASGAEYASDLKIEYKAKGDR